jgi:uncharacterized protein (TIGR04255 family)
MSIAMDDTTLQLRSAPIIEAVVDIDCDLPPGIDVASLESAGAAAYGAEYPKAGKRFVAQMQVEAAGEQAATVTARQGLFALQFMSADDRQLVQVRPQGYSFNRLAPYTSLDLYLPEIERTWREFVQLARPLQVRVVRLRFINRLLLPMTEGRVQLDDFLSLGPRLPDESRLVLAGFFHQNSAVEPATGNAVNVTMATQPVESEKLPVILDIEAYYNATLEPADWGTIRERIQSLRLLKNLVFRKSLTPSCLNQFRE